MIPVAILINPSSKSANQAKGQRLRRIRHSPLVPIAGILTGLGICFTGFLFFEIGIENQQWLIRYFHTTQEIQEPHQVRLPHYLPAHGHNSYSIHGHNDWYTPFGVAAVAGLYTTPYIGESE